MRFYQKDKNLILPIRKIQIIGLDLLTDNYSVFFKMKAFFDFTSIQSLSEGIIKIPKNDSEYNDTHLFFNSNFNFSRNFSTEVDDNENWVKLVDLIYKENKLSINQKAKNSVYIRYNTPIAKKAAKISSLHKYQNNHEIFGDILKEYTSYDFKIYHRVPCLLNTNQSFF
mgnify:CR=1 FL=1